MWATHGTASSAVRFENVSTRITRGRRLAVAGVLGGAARPRATLEEIPTARGRSVRPLLAFRVHGGAMAGDGVLDGDYLLVERRKDVRHGETIVAEIEGRPTVKRCYVEPDGSVRLQPANTDVLPFPARFEGMRIRGVLVGVVRKHGFASRHPQDSSAPTISHQSSDRARVLQTSAPRTRRREKATERATRERLRALGLRLRALRATYAASASPRLRRTLIREAANIYRQMRNLAAEPR